MKSRVFGQSGIEISILGYGAGNLGERSLQDSDVANILNSVIDFGINLIDTARSYGQSEERIGKHLKWKRKECILSTKVGYGIPGYEDWTAPMITAGIEHALRQLQTDYIDIIHLHSCPLETLQSSGVVEALEKSVSEGKVRVAAYSGENEALQWAIESGRFGAIQTSVNYCDQRVLDTMIPAAKSRGMGVIAKRPLANAPWRFDSEPATGDAALQAYWRRATAMAIPTGEYDWDELAIRFAAYAPGVDTCLVGTANMAHLKRNVEAVERGALPDNIVDGIRSCFRSKDQDWIGQI